MIGNLQEHYAALLASGDILPDPAQARAVTALDGLCAELAQEGKRGWWPFGRRRRAVPRGLYLYGLVGRGKSMLMDMFFEAAPVQAKRRVHFHQFMLEIHAAQHEWRQKPDHGQDPLRHIAAQVFAENRLLCFDEFHVTDIADAMILGRLFTALFEAGITLVATSNWAPDDLYTGGLQRHLFLPFIDILKNKVKIVALDGERDYRLDRLAGKPVFFTPLNGESSGRLAAIFAALTDNAPPEPERLTVLNRPLTVPCAARGVAWYDFEELCDRPLGAADYLALADHYHTLILDSVPQLGTEQRNATMRFITLIDALYEAKTKLIMASAVPVEQLCRGGEHAFAFQRTVSRLTEMQAEDYRKTEHELRP